MTVVLVLGALLVLWLGWNAGRRFQHAAERWYALRLHVRATRFMFLTFRSAVQSAAGAVVLVVLLGAALVGWLVLR